MTVLYVIVIMAAVAATAPQDIQVTLDVVDSGATSTTGRYLGRRLQFSEEKPEGVTRTPDAAAARYGAIEIGPKGLEKTIVFMIDEPVVGEASKLYVDANANGDLTDDPAPTWVAHTFKNADGVQSTRMTGDVTVPMNYGGAERQLVLGMYKKDVRGPEEKSRVLFYWSEYHRDAKVALGDKEYSTVLVDRWVTGDFSTPKSSLAVDLNADGKFASGEEFETSKPFNIGGVTYEFSNIAPDGSSFTLVRSSKHVDETLPQIDVSIGKKVPNFKVTSTDGDAIQWQSTYKGKVVMLDFWATWCAPCMKEMPGLVDTYNKFKDSGFDVLGVSLDREDALERINDVTDKNGMTWHQIYDGKYFRSALAGTFGIRSLPAALLIDGDTGEILASGDSLRGEELEATVAAAIKQKAME
ncbi:Thiol-disulfide oxidoreductase ResA [Pirellulimonas nuda]|uniref:Thiol-disulfide oxidoreductase ResA n=1 Tax=Pirellulimonas nuda TaxID=2528009 RepID=A0A518DBH9_9BACT|nr:TlpA disulfide reductase family protein [Pirellulimonas nuda]QDU88820.1 Thiol-disulfide oxidoreductase ResA [Pirellulimonas nuda]